MVLVLALLSVCSQRMCSGQTQPSPAVKVTFLYLTNAVGSTNVEGFFLITNTLNTHVYIWRNEIQAAAESDWALVIREFHSPGMIEPHEQFLFWTRVPQRGGNYRLAFYTENDGPNSAFFSRAFRVSAGPPMKAEDLFPLDTYHLTPTNLLNRIVNCDHIIVTNRFGFEKEYAGFSEQITGLEMTRIVRAVSSLWVLRHSPNSSAACDWQLQFYSGTNRLDTVDFQSRIVRYDGHDYPDETGVFDKLYSGLLKQTSQ